MSNRYLQLTAFDIAQRFIGTKEVEGQVNNPTIMAMLRLDSNFADGRGDETPWCSAFANYVAWLLRLPRSKSLSARSWLAIGAEIPYDSAEAGFDVVVLKRGEGPQPGPDVLAAPGHVGFFAGRQGKNVLLLGGNQGNMVSIAPFPTERILGIRRLV